MNNQFCKNCGQANFPDASTCSKCGESLAGAGGSAFRQEDPPPTMAGGAIGNAARPAKKSNKMYWIIGGLVAFLILFVGLVLVAAVGIFVYKSYETGDVAREEQELQRKETNLKKEEDIFSDDSEDTTKPDSDNPMGDVTFPSGEDIDFGDESKSDATDQSLLSFFFDKKSVVGKFKLKKATTSTDKTIFPNRSAGAQAEYQSGRIKIIHRVAIYRSVDDARSDIATYKAGLRRLRAKIKSSKEDQIIYTRGGLVYLAFYNQQGGLHEISSRNGKDIITYYNSYFKQ